VDVDVRLEPPVWLGGPTGYILGTDGLGRDILSRILYGGRISLLYGASAVLVAGTVGTVLGLFTGYYGGVLDSVVMRLADIQLGFPQILLAIAVIGVVGRGSLALIGVLSLSGWVAYARTVRGTVLSLREKEFIDSAKAIGCGGMRIVFRHVLPNVPSPVLVIATMQFATMIMLEASLSFFGLGVQPPTPSWGGIMSEGRGYITVAWWVTTFPGLTLSALVIGINLLGDGLRDVLDPTLRTEEV
jgi:peptide/nickel transport system permease protein